MGLAARPGRGVPAVHDAHGTRQTAGFRMARRTGTGWSRRQTAATSRRAWLRVERMVSRARDFGKAMAAHQGRGAAVLLAPDPHQRRPSGPEHAACRGVLRGQSEPPGGLVRPLNTWPHDRHDSRRRSSRRSAVVTRDSPVRWPAVPGLASLPPLPVTRLPLRVRQHHKTSVTPLRNGPGNTANTVRPRDDPAGGGRVNGCSWWCIVR